MYEKIGQQKNEINIKIIIVSILPKFYMFGFNANLFHEILI